MTDMEIQENQQIDDVDTEIEKADQEFIELVNKTEFGNYNGEDRVISSFDAKAEIAVKHENLTQYDAGFPSMDRIFDFQIGELVIISGTTGHGKTTFARSLTKNFAERGIGCLWFCYEGGMSNFLNKFSPLPMFYLPRRLIAHTLKWIEERIIESKIKYKVKMIFIDHLHYLIQLGQAVNTSLLIGAIMRELKQLAVRQNVIIFLLAHTQKLRYEIKPSLADMRDSSFIAQESDCVMIIRRAGIITPEGEKWLDKARLYLLKHRRTGETGIFYFQHMNGIFGELDEESVKELQGMEREGG